MINIKKLLAVGIILLFTGVAVAPITADGSSTGNTIYVDDDNTEGPWDGSIEHPYQYIQDGIDNASDGDIIYVYSGTYHEKNIKVDKKLSLYGLTTDTNVGDGIGSPIVDGNNSGAIFIISASGCLIDGFIAKDPGKRIGGGSSQAGFVISSSNCIISNCSVVGLFYTGIYLKPESRADNALIYNNMIDGGIKGIYMPYEPTGGSRNINISENKITNASYAVELDAGKNNSFYKNHISSNGRGILLRYGGNTNLISNNISNNEEYGIRIEITDYNNYRHCIRSNSICFNGGSGIYLGDSYRNTISDNTICFNGGHGISILQSEGGSSDSNNITNNIIKSNENYEIYINGASDNKINYNIINDNKIYGSLALWYGNGNIITGNTFFNGGLLLSDSIGNTISNNTVNDKSLVYYEGVNFTDEIKNAGQVILVRCNKISIENQDLSNTSVGIQLFGTTKCNIRKNKISNNEFGIHILDNSRDNTISRNAISDNDEGIVIANSDSNLISENNFIKNRRNARLLYATENRWRNNYWDRPRILPKPIFGIGVAFDFTLFPWINFDWHPAREPYDISMGV